MLSYGKLYSESRRIVFPRLPKSSDNAVIADAGARFAMVTGS